MGEGGSSLDGETGVPEARSARPPLGNPAEWLGQERARLDQLIQQPPLSLDEIKERACAPIDANPDDWRDDEAIAGEAAPPRDEQDMLDELQASARAARSLLQLIHALFGEELAG
jgi:hypothetical protein